MPQNKTDTRVLKMIDAWISYAKTNGIATPRNPGTQPEDTDVITFLSEYLKTEHKITLSKKGIAGIQTIINRQPEGLSTEQAGYLNKVKELIKTTLTPVQRKQLKRELTDV